MGWDAELTVLVLPRCAAAFYARSAASVCAFVVRLVEGERYIWMCVFARGYGYGYGGGRVVKLEYVFPGETRRMDWDSSGGKQITGVSTHLGRDRATDSWTACNCRSSIMSFQSE